MQREFVFVVISLLFVSSFGIGFVIHHTLHDAAYSGALQFGTVSPYEILSQASYHLMVRVILILFATLFVLTFFGIFFLHRIAGPVYRFHHVLLRINDGEIPAPIHLREGDFFIEMASEINRLVKRLQFERNRNDLVRQKMDQVLAGKPGGDVAKSCTELKSLLNREHEEP